MKTVYNKNGKAFQIAQDVDAKVAIDSGHYFPYPPGTSIPIADKEKVDPESMTKAQIVNLMRNEFGVSADVNKKKDLLLAQYRELKERGVKKEEPEKDESEIDEPEDIEDVKPSGRKKLGDK